MALARTLLSRRFHSLLEPHNLAFFDHIVYSNPLCSRKNPPFQPRPFASSSQTLAESAPTHGIKTLHFLFQEPSEQRIDYRKLVGKSKQGEATGLSEKTGHKDSEVGRLKKKKPEKKLKKSGESNVKFVQEEEEEVEGKSKQGKAVCLSEETEHKKSEVRRVKAEKKKRKKKLKKPVEWKIKFIEEEEVVVGELHGKPTHSEAVSLSEETEHEKSEVGRVKDEKKKPKLKLKIPGTGNVKFIEEEEEVVKGEQPKKPEPKRLFDLFSQGEKSNEAYSRRFSPAIAPVETHKEVKQREPTGSKKVSLDMELFLSYLYKEGYFRDANFVKSKKFDLSWFDNDYARYYTLSAAQKLGKDKQEISKWLSGSDLNRWQCLAAPLLAGHKSLLLKDCEPILRFQRTLFAVNVC
ncbi:uncharacterized protein LOC129314377 isoform X1 [Prosopis cineraria]|uniref:uncharacterized protein LOC129314377 isoform X1 n=2 Tax=Prosopis cineraria TaxID=364024 RepID=UPI00240FFD49|nr:uncharacterized protein LOC129314377 isoform X1 [Prosopis cineraria]